MHAMICCEVLCQHICTLRARVCVKCCTVLHVCRVCGEVVPGLVAKAFNGRPKTKQLAFDICLTFIEVEKQDVVQVGGVGVVWGWVCKCAAVCGRRRTDMHQVSLWREGRRGIGKQYRFHNFH